jgi:hypothetical protein
MRDAVAMTYQHWTADMPLWGKVTGMLAFGYEECNQYDRAEDLAFRALASDPRDPWSVHCLAHVMEMQCRPQEGKRLLRETRDDWEAGALLSHHLQWHWGLFNIEEANAGVALQRQDTCFIGRKPAHAQAEAAEQHPIADSVLALADVASLFWRLELNLSPAGPVPEGNRARIAPSHPLDTDYMAQLVETGRWALPKDVAVADGLEGSGGVSRDRMPFFGSGKKALPLTVDALKYIFRRHYGPDRSSLLDPVVGVASTFGRPPSYPSIRDAGFFAYRRMDAGDDAMVRIAEGRLLESPNPPADAPMTPLIAHPRQVRLRTGADEPTAAARPIAKGSFISSFFGKGKKTNVDDDKSEAASATEDREKTTEPLDSFGAETVVSPTRWNELARRFWPYLAERMEETKGVADGRCPPSQYRIGQDLPSTAFNDVHCAMVLVAAGDTSGLEGLLSAMRAAVKQESNGTVARVALTTGEGMVAFWRGEFSEAVSKLQSTRPEWFRLGGSHAQRDIFEQTLLHSSILAGKADLACALASNRLVAFVRPILQTVNDCASFSMFGFLLSLLPFILLCLQCYATIREPARMVFVWYSTSYEK